MSPSIPTLNQGFIHMIDERQSALHVLDEQMNQALGFQHPKTFGQIKEGLVKLPISKVPALATALSLDTATVLRAFMIENMPEVLTLVEAFLVSALHLTSAEAKLIESCRAQAAGRDVVPTVLDGNAVVALVVA